MYESSEKNVIRWEKIWSIEVDLRLSNSDYPNKEKGFLTSFPMISTRQGNGKTIPFVFMFWILSFIMSRMFYAAIPNLQFFHNLVSSVLPFDYLIDVPFIIA